MEYHRGALVARGVAAGLTAVVVTGSIIVALTLLPAGMFAGTSLTTGTLGSTRSFALVNYQPELCTVAPCAAPVSGWLHTNPGDTNIYDSRGSIVRLVGLNAMGLEYGTGTSGADQCRFGWGGEDAGGFSAGEFDNIASWGFNFVRLPISWENLEPTAPSQAFNGNWVHKWNAAYLSELDYFVSQFGQRHIAVILDFHQLDISPAFQQAPGGVHGTFCEGWGESTWLYPRITSPTTRTDLTTAICSFFTDNSMVGDAVPPPIEGLKAAEQMLASRYSGNPTVIGIDIFNEPWFPRSCGPNTTAAGLLMNFDTEISEAISAANPHLLVVFEEPPKNLTPM